MSRKRRAYKAKHRKRLNNHFFFFFFLNVASCLLVTLLTYIMRLLLKEPGLSSKGYLHRLNLLLMKGITFLSERACPPFVKKLYLHRSFIYHDPLRVLTEEILSSVDYINICRIRALDVKQVSHFCSASYCFTRSLSVSYRDTSCQSSTTGCVCHFLHSADKATIQIGRGGSSFCFRGVYSFHQTR